VANTPSLTVPVLPGHRKVCNSVSNFSPEPGLRSMRGPELDEAGGGGAWSRPAAVQTPTFFRSLDPATLRALASLLEESPVHARRFVDPDQAAAELAEILDRGTTPTIGWWRRHLISPISQPRGRQAPTIAGFSVNEPSPHNEGAR
jgi:hypothetical protein